MGEGLIQFYQTKLKKEYKMAFIFTFFATLLIHLYKFANNLPNNDSLYNYYSDQNVLGSGRWALSLACGISSYWDLPWVIGLLSCVFIALTVVVIVALFRIKNPILIGLFGAVIASAPATTETFFFLYTADGYMISMFLAALAVYFSRIEEKRVSCLILSGVCICVACGIYQAYVSFALILAVCYFIDVLFQNSHSKQECFRWVIRQAIIYVTSLASYFVIWKLCLHFSGTVANNYQGISEVGKISANLLINGLIKAVYSTMFYFLQWNVLEHGFTLYSVLNIVFLILMGISLIVAILKSGILKRKWAVALLALCLVSIIPFSCMWHFVSPAVRYRPMMLHSLALLFVLTAILYEKWTSSVTKNAIAVFLTVIIFYNSLMANISYFYMNLSYERAYAEAVEMMMDIRDFQKEQEFSKVAIVGNRFYEVQYESLDSETGEKLIPSKLLILSSGLQQTPLFDSEHITRFLETNFGFKFESLPKEERKELFKTDEVQAMNCWPEKGSIAVIDDTLVIKMSNIEEF